jgi:hypothetical protein
MSLPSSFSVISTDSSVDLRSWLCPFAENTAVADDNHHPDSHFKSGFIATALEEASHVPYIRKGFTSYQAALDANKPFSEAFIDSERVSTAKAIQQLHLLSSVLQDLIIKVADLLDDVVPEELRAELHLARVWIAKHRANLVSCHVFFKINYSLARDKPNNGIVEMSSYAVKEHQGRLSSTTLADGYPISSKEPKRRGTNERKG